MIHKFIEMLYSMYGDGYEDAIECFSDYIFQNGKQDLWLDELFIEWADFVKQGKAMA